MNYVQNYLDEASRIIAQLDRAAIEKLGELLAELRAQGGRLFFLGVGGGAANCSHAVNDFRKICGIESYTPVDNISELSARVNDDGWDTIFVNWLKGSRLQKIDGIFVFSVGGGNSEKNISTNLVKALEYGKAVGAKIFGIVGRDGGFTAKVADACIVIPTVNPETITPHTESFQAVIWHLIVSHPQMKISEMKWESVR
jgi:D-sedoheptulose 7-phosphate isomerase